MKKICSLIMLSWALYACGPSGNTDNGDDTDTTTTETLDTTAVDTTSQTPQDPLADLYARYTDGEISECVYNGAMVWSCGFNGPDTGSEIFDAEGNQLGACYYNTGAVDQICNEIEECKVIYRVADNIWGAPAVDIREED